MPTKNPRVGVIRDGQLDRALQDTRPLLSEDETRSAAAQVRALALRGARALTDGSEGAAALRRELRDEHGAIPATRSIADLPPPLGEVDPDDPTPATDALDWVRGKDRDY